MSALQITASICGLLVVWALLYRFFRGDNTDEWHDSHPWESPEDEHQGNWGDDDMRGDK